MTNLPPRPSDAIALKASDKRRVKAFRLPWSYVADSICGYQGNADKFSIYRMSPGLLPEGFKIVLMVQEHPRNDMYFLVEHPSFPEVNSTEKIEAVEITIDEVDVHRVSGQSEGERARAEFLAMPGVRALLKQERAEPIVPLDVLHQLAIQRNKNAATNLGAKQLLARSRHKGVNL